jgi:hypothetical protein
MRWMPHSAAAMTSSKVGGQVGQFQDHLWTDLVRFGGRSRGVRKRGRPTSNRAVPHAMIRRAMTFRTVAARSPAEH